MKVKSIILSVICLIAISFVTLAIAEQGTLNQNTIDKVQSPPKKIEVMICRLKWKKSIFTV